MNGAFVLHVIWAFAVIALVLAGLLYAGRSIQRGRIVASTGNRLLSTIESAALAQNVTIHVVRVAETYYLLGAGTAGVSLLADVPASTLEPYFEAQRTALFAQRASLRRWFMCFRRP
jgi:flagellar biogenesis protein FliO